MTEKLRLWTAADDAIAIDPDLSAAAAARLVNRTVTAVYARRQLLRGTSSRPRWRGAKQKPRLRPAGWVLAKTCRRCGEFLQIAEFTRKGGSWESYCKRCTRTRGSELYATNDAFRTRLTESTRRSVVRIQGETATAARNNRKEWTGPELELLTRTDLSHREMALALGRSLHSVRHMLRKIRSQPREQRMAGTGEGYQ